jgi:hypothetical protein
MPSFGSNNRDMIEARRGEPAISHADESVRDAPNPVMV